MNTDDWKTKQAQRDAAAATLRAMYPRLVGVSKDQDSLQAAAKNCRIELKAAFPGVKFSVKTSRFSMGDNLRVAWIDGPTRAQVEEIINRYSGGSFDGMTDSYTYARNAWTDAFGEAKYVFAERKMSDAGLASAVRSVFARYPGNLAGYDQADVCAKYRKGALWSTDVGMGVDRYGLAGLIGDEFSKRTWAVSRYAIPAVAAVLETAEG